MTEFVKFVEENDWEGETWTFWLQVDGNEAELEKLADLIDAESGASDYPYRLDLGHVREESQVDLLCDEADEGYMPEHNKVTGTLTLPVREFDGDDYLYKGRICDLFK